MLVVVSPAKALDFEPAPGNLPATQPRMFDQAVMLARTMRGQSRARVAAMMDLSDNLARLNVERFRAFAPEQCRDNAKQAALAFAGDTYRGLDANTLPADAMTWAQDHLRILSGLYGLLRPLDLIQPYRLEMGTRLHTRRGESLYDFWGRRIAKGLAEELRDHATPVVINAASQEYFRAVDLKALKARVVTPVFKEERDGVARIISFSAKQARGAIARFMIDERLDQPEGLKDFDRDGYRFQPAASSESQYLFLRDAR